MLRILSYVGIGVTPSGPPRRLRPVQVVSLLDTVLYSKQNSLRVMGFVLSWSIRPSSTGSELMLFIVYSLPLSNL